MYDIQQLWTNVKKVTFRIATLPYNLYTVRLSTLKQPSARHVQVADGSASSALCPPAPQRAVNHGRMLARGAGNALRAWRQGEGLSAAPREGRIRGGGRGGTRDGVHASRQARRSHPKAPLVLQLARLRDHVCRPARWCQHGGVEGGEGCEAGVGRGVRSD